MSQILHTYIVTCVTHIVTCVANVPHKHCDMCYIVTCVTDVLCTQIVTCVADVPHYNAACACVEEGTTGSCADTGERHSEARRLQLENKEEEVLLGAATSSYSRRHSKICLLLSPRDCDALVSAFSMY